MRTKVKLGIIIILALVIPLLMFTGALAITKADLARLLALERNVYILQTEVVLAKGTIAVLQAQIDALTTALTAAQSVLDLAPYVSVNQNEINQLSGPHVVFEGANVHFRSGSGYTDDAESLSGLGNLIIGYNEEPTETPLEPGDRSGPHNLVVGDQHRFLSYGGLVAGSHNTVSGPGASVSGGSFNMASDEYSSVSGGVANWASGWWASVSGGFSNEARGNWSWVGGGQTNRAFANLSSVSGGYQNEASGDHSHISGGHDNTVETSGQYGTVSGGANNTAIGESSSVCGGQNNTANASYENDRTPDYDSDWRAIDPGSDLTLNHNLLGDTDNYIVDMQFKDESSKPVHSLRYGGDIYYWRNKSLVRGAMWYGLTNEQITVYREQDDEDVDYIRIRIWNNH